MRNKCDLQVFVGFTYFNISHMLRRQHTWNIFSQLHTEGSGRPSYLLLVLCSLLQCLLIFVVCLSKNTSNNKTHTES